MKSKYKIFVMEQKNNIFLINMCYPKPIKWLDKSPRYNFTRRFQTKINLLDIEMLSY